MINQLSSNGVLPAHNMGKNPALWYDDRIAPMPGQVVTHLNLFCG